MPRDREADVRGGDSSVEEGSTDFKSPLHVSRWQFNGRCHPTYG